MKLLIPLLCLLLVFSAYSAEVFVARIDNPIQADFTYFDQAGFDICGYKPGVYLDILMNDNNFNAFKQTYPSLHITQTEARLKANLTSQDRDIPGYRNYQQLVTEIMALQAQHPSLISVESLGETWASQYADDGYNAYQDYDHQLWAIKLSDNVTADEDEPCFYFVGEHHAREPISMEMVLTILNHLVDGYGSDPELTALVDNSQIWFVPLLNPDGHKIVIDQTDVWWRKNLHDYNNNHSIDIGTQGSGPDGADLNRNYGYQWGFMNASGNASSITYHGSEAFSEVETQAFRDLLASQHFLAGISYHTYGEYVLYPFGYMYDLISPDAAEQQALANGMANSFPAQGGGNYTPMPSYSLYPVSGSSDDWAYGTHGTFAYTIEMATEFIPPASDVPLIIQNGLSAAKLLLKRVNQKVLKGHVTDAITGLPLQAQIHINGLDDHPLRTWISRSDSLHGSFYRFLPVGTYSVQILCPGYESVIMNYVQITADAPTIYDVALLPSVPSDMEITLHNALGIPLSNAQLSFPDLNNALYNSDAEGRILLSAWSPGSYRIVVTASGYEQLNRILAMNGPSIIITMDAQASLSEDFETDLGNWQTTGTWGRSSSNYHSGSFSLADSPTGNYTSNANSYCKLQSPLSLQGVQNANLQFWAKHNIALDGDYCELMISTNGTQWQYLDHFVGVSDWTLHSYSLNHLLGSQVYLRFQLRTGGSSNADGIYIDDFKFFASANPVDLQDHLCPLPEISFGSYPNPFKNVLNFSLETATKLDEPLKVEIFNLKGQLVKTLDLSELNPGITKLPWNGIDRHNRACSSGIYFARLSRKGTVLQILKAVLMK